MSEPIDDNVSATDLTQYRDKDMFKIHDYLEKHDWQKMDADAVMAAGLPDGLKLGLMKWLAKHTKSTLYVCVGCRTAACWSGYGDYTERVTPGKRVEW